MSPPYPCHREAEGRGDPHTHSLRRSPAPSRTGRTKRARSDQRLSRSLRLASRTLHPTILRTHHRPRLRHRPRQSLRRRLAAAQPRRQTLDRRTLRRSNYRLRPGHQRQPPHPGPSRRLQHRARLAAVQRRRPGSRPHRPAPPRARLRTVQQRPQQPGVHRQLGPHLQVAQRAHHALHRFRRRPGPARSLLGHRIQLPARAGQWRRIRVGRRAGTLRPPLRRARPRRTRIGLLPRHVPRPGDGRARRPSVPGRHARRDRRVGRLGQQPRVGAL